MTYICVVLCLWICLHYALRSTTRWAKRKCLIMWRQLEGHVFKSSEAKELQIPKPLCCQRFSSHACSPPTWFKKAPQGFLQCKRVNEMFHTANGTHWLLFIIRPLALSLWHKSQLLSYEDLLISWSYVIVNW